MAEAFGPAADVLTSGEALQGRVYVEDLPCRLKAMSTHFSTRDPYECEYRLRGEGGKLIWVHDRGAAEFSADGRPVRMIGTLRIISTRKLKEAQLEYLASFDDLTGHYNRGRLKEALDHALIYSSRYSVPGAYLAIGIDNLTAVNDAFGYETADTVIVTVGQRLDRCLRASDIVGRMGGDRFGIVLSNCPQSDIGIAADKLLQAVRQTPIETPSGSIHVTISIGGIAYLDHVPSAQETMSRADGALQEAKRAGRDRFALFSDTDGQRHNRRRMVEIAADVQTALKEDRLLFAFQPVVDSGARTVDHYECLLRLRRDDGTIVPASAFVPVVEQTGLMRLIDRRALDLAVNELVRYPGVKLALNISGLTAGDRQWLRALNAMLKGRADIARRLIVEITETVALQDIEETAHFVAAVRELGCRVALDDFGAGYTSFRNLKALSVDCVKIDGSFVKGLADNIDNQLFIRTLLGLAEGFGLATVAECVETAADAVHLERRGVRYLQGYYFGVPSVERPWLARTAPPRLTVVKAPAVRHGNLATPGAPL
ncbi:MAG: GGDEF and EAL domain-containing protein [Rhodospirillales bacterium]|nr:GGDEF and EAL domain-containing protein [Rhodospirillales bacterium]